MLNAEPQVCYQTPEYLQSSSRVAPEYPQSTSVKYRHFIQVRMDLIRDYRHIILVTNDSQTNIQYWSYRFSYLQKEIKRTRPNWATSEQCNNIHVVR